MKPDGAGGVIPAMDDAEVARFWGQGEARVSPPVAAAVAAITLVTVVMLVALRAVAGSPPDEWSDARDHAGWVTLMVTASGAAALIAVSGLRSVSWWARAAIVLVAAHLAMLTAIGALWYQRPPSPVRRPLVDELPAHWIGLGLGAAVIALAVIAARRRRVLAWLQGTVVFALVLAVVLGAWLPLVAAAASGWSGEDASALHLARQTFAPALLVPAALAAAIAIVVMRWPRAGRGRATEVGGAVAISAIVLAAVALADAGGRAIRIYEHQSHLLIAGALFACGALAALAIAHLQVFRIARRDAARPAPWAQRGAATVDDARRGEPRPIARQVFHGWLGGFATEAEAFTLRTGGLALHVPAGAHVIAPLAPWTIAAEPGATGDVVRNGDHVRVTGFVRPPDDAPFRAVDAAVVGSDGLTVIVDREPDATIRRDLVLALWRPCLLFLIVSVLAALPAIAAATAGASYWDSADAVGLE